MRTLCFRKEKLRLLQSLALQRCQEPAQWVTHFGNQLLPPKLHRAETGNGQGLGNVIERSCTNWHKTDGVRASLIPLSDLSAASRIKREPALDFCCVPTAASKVT